MQYMRFCMLGLVLAGLFLSGCATSRLTRLDEVLPGEAVAVAKVRVIHNGKEVPRGFNVVFDCAQAGTAKGQCGVEENGYIFARFPVGPRSIRMVVLPSGLVKHSFEADELTFQLRGGGTINYIGDITMEWRGIGNGTAVAAMVAGGVSGGFVGSILGGELVNMGEGLAISVKSNPAEAQKAFSQKFPTARSITPSLLVVKPHK
jgi:hypothetical protein